jgi:CRISPR-associated endoribonuclease Cas6
VSSRGRARPHAAVCWSALWLRVSTVASGFVADCWLAVGHLPGTMSHIVTWSGVIVPVRIVVDLSPSGRHVPVPPPHTGPAVYYAVLDVLRSSAGGGVWAAAVHDSASHKVGAFPHKQIACTSLLDEHDRLATVDSHRVRFEVGVLVDELTAPLLVALKEADGVRIARCRYRIADLGLVAAQPYQELRDSADPGARWWPLTLLTPAAFESSKQEGARRLRTLPEPEWVFGSLLARWQTLAAYVPLAEGTAETIASHLAVADWSLRRSEHLVLPADAGKGRKELIWSGSIGAVTYRLADADSVAPPVRASVDALARFAAYAGVGDRTNVGMGFVRASTAMAGRT